MWDVEKAFKCPFEERCPDYPWMCFRCMERYELVEEAKHTIPVQVPIQLKK